MCTCLQVYMLVCVLLAQLCSNMVGGMALVQFYYWQYLHVLLLQINSPVAITNSLIRINNISIEA